MAPGSGITGSAIKWLETLLAERFGTPLHLEHFPGGDWRLVVPGSSGHITLDSTFHAVPAGTSDIPCGTWDPPAEGYASPLGVPLPMPGLQGAPTPLISRSADGLHIGYDIPGLAYWMLNRLEEIGRTDLDNHERFPATASHTLRHGYLERPIVDEWLDILGQAIRRQWPSLHLRSPEFRVIVSHDVDKPSLHTFSGTRSLMRRAVKNSGQGKLREALLALRIALSRRRKLQKGDPLNTFDWLMTQSEARGLKSAFYFICGRTSPSKDAAYDPGHPAIRHLMRNIHTRGHEVGLHPSYNTFRSPDALAVEADLLRSVCREEGITQGAWGGRMHFLRWEQPTTLLAWENAGLAYDSTLGYADRPGFRCGTCFEYPAFDHLTGRALGIRIRPLVAMECTVMAPRYLGLGEGPAALEKFLQLKRACKAVGGQFTLLWHNSELATPSSKKLYLNVIDGA